MSYEYVLNHYFKLGKYMDDFNLVPEAEIKDLNRDIVELSGIQLIANDTNMPNDFRVLSIDRSGDHSGLMPLRLSQKLEVIRGHKTSGSYICQEHTASTTLRLYAKELENNGYRIDYKVEKRDDRIGNFLISASVTHPEIPEFWLKFEVTTYRWFANLSQQKDCLVASLDTINLRSSTYEQKLKDFRKGFQNLKAAADALNKKTAEELIKEWEIPTK